MNEEGQNPYEPVNDPIKAELELSSCIRILDFDEALYNGEIAKIQVFYERIAQEIYNARKKNYSWGFRVIEPEFITFSNSIVLVSKLYRAENLKELNSVIFKLFIEINNIILATALHMHIPIKGLIRYGESYQGILQSRKPALMSGKDPLILSDLLKVFSIDEIFPSGFSGRLIPAVEIPYHFGKGLCKSLGELEKLDSIGIFMPLDALFNQIAHVTILSNMMVESEVDGVPCFICNWMEWMRNQSECAPENILAFSESIESDNSHAKAWHSLSRYASKL